MRPSSSLDGQRFLLFALFVLLWGVVGCGGKQTGRGDKDGPSKAQDKTSKPSASKVNTRFIPEAAVFALLADAKWIRSAPELELMPWEILHAVGKQQVGVDLLELDEIVFILAPPEGPARPNYGWLLHFSKPQKLSGAMIDGLEQTKIGTRTAYQIPAGISAQSPMQLALPEARTIVMAVPELMVKMLAAEDRTGDSQLISLLSQVESGSTVSAHLACKSLRPLAKQFTTNLSLEEPMEKYAPLIDQISSAHAHVSLKGKSRIILIGNNADDTAEMEKLALEALAWGKESLLKMLKPQQMDDPLVAKAMRTYTLRVGNRLVSMLKPHREGTRLTISIDNSLPISVAIAGVVYIDLQRVFRIE